MEGGLLNGKAFRYVHHYMNEQVVGCRGGGLGGGVKYCTRMPYKRVGLWPWMALPDCRSIFAGNRGETFGY